MRYVKSKKDSKIIVFKTKKHFFDERSEKVCDGIEEAELWVI